MPRGPRRRGSVARQPYLIGVSIAAFAACLSAGCGYQLQIAQVATATPGPLNVHVIGNPAAGASATPGAGLAQLLQQYLGTPAAGGAAPQTAAPQPPASAPQAAVLATSATPAAAFTLAAGDTQLRTAPYNASTSGAGAAPGASSASAPTFDSNLAAAPAYASGSTGQPSADQPSAAPTPAPSTPAPAVSVASATPASDPSSAARAAPAAPPASAAAPISTGSRHTAQTAGIHLLPGSNDLVYMGSTLPAGQAFAALTGLFQVVYIAAPGASETLVYHPGDGAAPIVPTGSRVRIYMLRGATVDFPAAPPN